MEQQVQHFIVYLQRMGIVNTSSKNDNDIQKYNHM